MHSAGSASSAAASVGSEPGCSVASSGRRSWLDMGAWETEREREMQASRNAEILNEVNAQLLEAAGGVGDAGGRPIGDAAGTRPTARPPTRDVQGGAPRPPPPGSLPPPQQQ